MTIIIVNLIANLNFRVEVGSTNQLFFILIGTIFGMDHE
jgi:hypothetical protein